jgi:protein-disulfide isomerase
MNMERSIMSRALLLGLASTLALAGCGGNTAPTTKTEGTETAAVQPSSGTNWAETTSVTADGGMLMGNPAAPVKLMEYGALSCSHCATFSKDSSEALRKYVAKGTVSYEFRTFLLNPLDVPASLLARCNGSGAFFAIAEQLFEKQSEWMGKAATITEEDQKSWQGKSPNAVATDLAGKLGLVDFVKQRGVSGEKANACLADPAGVKQLEGIVNKGTEQGVAGTPTFFINGAKIDGVGTWADLEPKLRDAGA